jgi:hypothetical protein
LPPVFSFRRLLPTRMNELQTPLWAASPGQSSSVLSAWSRVGLSAIRPARTLRARSALSAATVARITGVIALAGDRLATTRQYIQKACTKSD